MEPCSLQSHPAPMSLVRLLPANTHPPLPTQIIPQFYHQTPSSFAVDAERAAIFLCARRRLQLALPRDLHILYSFTSSDFREVVQEDNVFAHSMLSYSCIPCPTVVPDVSSSDKLLAGQVEDLLNLNEVSECAVCLHHELS
jgi:hypothetical protein